jgi:hypothetical protein
MRAGFIRIFWGLLFVVLDVRINSLDLFLPDFVGYILIVTGLTMLAPYDEWFRRLKPIAMIMIVVSLSDLVEIEVEAKQAPRFRREWISLVTGDLSTLLPDQVNSAHLLRITHDGSAIDADRTNNPARDQDKLLAEYSDGTVVLILRYASADEALDAMEKKSDSEYSTHAIRKRGETDPSFRADQIHGRQGSTGSHIKTAAYSGIEVGDRSIQQWWSRGRSWWNPFTWSHEGGLTDRLLYIVEGYRASVDVYRSTFEDKSEKGNGAKVDVFNPISTVGNLLEAFLLWGLCSGVIALCVSFNNYGLMQIARRRRAFYLILTVPALALSLVSWIAPEVIFRVGMEGFVLLVPYVLLVLLSVALIMGLMRKAANTLFPNQPLP